MFNAVAESCDLDIEHVGLVNYIICKLQIFIKKIVGLYLPVKFDYFLPFPPHPLKLLAKKNYFVVFHIT